MALFYIVEDFFPFGRQHEGVNYVFFWHDNLSYFNCIKLNNVKVSDYKDNVNYFNTIQHMYCL